jgi:uncharacterized protein
VQFECNMKRRTFIKIAASGTLAAGIGLPLFSHSKTHVRDKWGELLPLNDFGSTGKKVTMLGLGGFHIGRMSERDAQATIETAIAGGIRFFDAAYSYVGGQNERHYGKLLIPKYRDEIFLMTKTTARDGKRAQQELDESMSRMNTDYLDLYLMHAVGSIDQVNQMRDNGVLDVFLRAKVSGKVKHIGFSGHTAPAVSRYLLDQFRDVVECNMLPVNVVDPSYESFIKEVIPTLEQRKLGIIGMKSLSGGSFWGGGFEGNRNETDRVIDHISVKDAFHFSLSMPVDVLVTGPLNPEMLQEKIDLANNFVKLTARQQVALIQKVARFANARIEYYKA